MQVFKLFYLSIIYYFHNQLYNFYYFQVKFEINFQEWPLIEIAIDKSNKMANNKVKVSCINLIDPLLYATVNINTTERK